MQVWKYKLDTTDFQVIDLPKGSQVLSLQMQDGVACVWVLVNPHEKELEPVIFDTYGTGHNIAFVGKFLGTYQLCEGALVFHVFTR